MTLTVRAVRHEDDEGEVVLDSGARMPLSRRYRNELKSRLSTRT